MFVAAGRKVAVKPGENVRLGGGGPLGMSLGPTVALVAAGLAVVGGTSYVSLMGGGPDSRAPAAQQVTGPRSSASTNGLSTYFDETFASVRTSTRSAAEIRTASIA